MTPNPATDLFLDYDESIAFAMQRTGLPQTLIEQVDRAQSIYFVLCGITAEDPEIYPEINFAELRKRHADLLPQRGRDGLFNMSFDAEAVFMIRYGLPWPASGTVIEAFTAFQETRGITDHGAAEIYRKWVQEWVPPQD